MRCRAVRHIYKKYVINFKRYYTLSLSLERTIFLKYVLVMDRMYNMWANGGESVSIRCAYLNVCLMPELDYRLPLPFLARLLLN